MTFHKHSHKKKLPQLNHEQDDKTSWAGLGSRKLFQSLIERVAPLKVEETNNDSERKHKQIFRRKTSPLALYFPLVVPEPKLLNRLCLLDKECNLCGVV